MDIWRIISWMIFDLVFMGDLFLKILKSENNLLFLFSMIFLIEEILEFVSLYTEIDLFFDNCLRFICLYWLFILISLNLHFYNWINKQLNQIIKIIF